MMEPEQAEGLSLRGDLQIDIAERVLRRHRADSRVLAHIVRVKDMYAQFPEHTRGLPDTASMTLYFDDADVKNELVVALRASLESDDLDEFARISTEELLAITET